MTYTDIMATARQKANLAEIRTSDLRTRTSRTGGLLIKVTGKDKQSKAGLLVGKLKEALTKVNVYVCRPSEEGVPEAFPARELFYTERDLLGAGGCGWMQA